MPTLGEKKWRINNLTLKKKTFQVFKLQEKKTLHANQEKRKNEKKLDFDYLIFPFTLFIIKKYK